MNITCRSRSCIGNYTESDKYKIGTVPEQFFSKFEINPEPSFKDLIEIVGKKKRGRPKKN